MAREVFHEVRIKGQPAEIYDAIVEPDKLGQWWIHATSGETTAGKTLNLGPGKGFQEVLVTEERQNELVRWRPTEAGISDWVGTEIEFKIIPEAERTLVHFKHSNYGDDAPMFPHTSLSWAVFLLSLRDLVETGKGMPYPNHFIRD